MSPRYQSCHRNASDVTDALVSAIPVKVRELFFQKGFLEDRASITIVVGHRDYVGAHTVGKGRNGQWCVAGIVRLFIGCNHLIGLSFVMHPFSFYCVNIERSCRFGMLAKGAA